jgi:hypothetical protein
MLDSPPNALILHPQKIQMKKKYMLLDAQILHQHDRKSDFPPQRSMDRLGVGDGVYVETPEEGVWVHVTEMDGDKGKGTVDIRLDHTDKHGLKYKSLVEFEKKNVFGISTRRIF